MRRLYAWHRGVQNLFLIRGSILRIVRLIKSKYTKGFVRSVVTLVYNLEKLRKGMGLKGTCLYLKACTILIIKVITDDPTDRNSTSYGIKVSLTKGKIPRILPLRFRNDIRRRD